MYSLPGHRFPVSSWPSVTEAFDPLLQGMVHLLEALPGSFKERSGNERDKGVLAHSDKGLDLQVLFQGLEEDLYLPSLFCG